MSIDLSWIPSWFLPLAMFSLADFFLVLFIRRGVETLKPSMKENKVWEDWILRSMPVILGGLAALVFKKYPYLSTLPSAESRMVYGMVAGGFSSFLWRMSKAVLQKKLGVQVPDVGDIEDTNPTLKIPKESIPPEAVTVEVKEAPKP